VQAAYRLLGKTQMAMDQLHMHYATAVHGAAFGVVRGYAVQADSSSGGNTLHKREYKELCKVCSY
jgi:hypothetical protein